MKKDCLAICLFDFFSGGVFIYKNMGSDSLHIYCIVSSWDCPETRYSKFHAAPGVESFLPVGQHRGVCP